MTPEAMKASYRRQMQKAGTVVLRRVAGAALSTVAEVTLRARVTGYEPREMVGDVQQGDRRVIALAEDIGDFPAPIKVGVDRIVIDGTVTTIRAVDDQTRRVGGVLIAYEIRVRGP